MARVLLLLFLAGGIGTLVRFGMTKWLSAPGLASPEAVPTLHATLIVNCVGCLAAGICWGVFEARGMLDSEWRTVLMIGFLGALTTLSTYALETVLVAESGSLLRAGLHVAATNVFGLLCLFGGIAIVRALSVAAGS